MTVAKPQSRVATTTAVVAMIDPLLTPPSLAQPHACDARHQVELRGPHVAEGNRPLAKRATFGREMVRDEPLVRDIELVDAVVAVSIGRDVDGLARP